MIANRIVVTGGREWNNRRIVIMALSEFAKAGVTQLIHGDCRGLDRMAGSIATDMGLDVLPMPAEWMLHEGCRCNEWRKTHSYCGYAGPRRNRQMLDKLPDVVLAFHPSIADSRGTKDCVNAAIERGLPVLLWDHSGRMTEITEKIE